MLRFRNVLGGLNLSPIASRDGGVKPAVDGDLLLLHGKRGVNAQFVLLRLAEVRPDGWDGNHHIERGQHANGMEQDPRLHDGIVVSIDRGNPIMSLVNTPILKAEKKSSQHRSGCGQ